MYKEYLKGYKLLINSTLTPKIKFFKIELKYLIDFFVPGTFYLSGSSIIA